MVEELIQDDREPNIFLPNAIYLIKNLLIASKKNNTKADKFVVVLVYSLYYALRKEDTINYNTDDYKEFHNKVITKINKN